MSRNLTASSVASVDRQNTLNNACALQKIQNDLDLPALEFEGERYLRKHQVAD